MTEIVGSDARFPRGRCEHCRKLYPIDQTAIYALTRLADQQVKRVRLCFICAHQMPKQFTAVKVSE
jgi:hypothetical protein